MWDFLPIHTVAFMRSDADIGQEDLARNLHFSSSQRYLMRLRSRFCAGQSSYFAPNSSNHVLNLALCTGAQSCWNNEGPSLNFSHNVGSKVLSNISWNAEALRFPFT